MTRRGCGARRLDLELSRAYAPPVKKSILLSHPSREGKSLFNLVQCALEVGEKSEIRNPKSESNLKSQIRLACRGTGGPPVPRSPHVRDDGYTALHLRVPLLQRLSDEQIFLLDQERHAGQLEVDRLIDRLRRATRRSSGSGAGGAGGIASAGESVENK